MSRNPDYEPPRERTRTEERESLLRECFVAIDTLLTKKPMLAAVTAGSTTLGNLRAELLRATRTAVSPAQAPDTERT